MTERGDKNNGITVQSKPYLLGILRILTNDCPAVNFLFFIYMDCFSSAIGPAVSNLKPLVFKGDLWINIINSHS